MWFYLHSVTLYFGAREIGIQAATIILLTHKFWRSFLKLSPGDSDSVGVE